MKKHILLIDDDEDEVEIFTGALQKLDGTFHCSYVKDAEHAYRILKKITPDFIFIDYNLPKINGLECLEEIRTIKNVNDIPVVIYSNFIDDKTAATAKKNGAIACLKKPKTVAILVKELKKILLR